MVDIEAITLSITHWVCEQVNLTAHLSTPKRLFKQWCAVWFTACGQNENVHLQLPIPGLHRYSNLLLLSCQGRWIFHIVDFKDTLAYVPAGKNATYPCTDEGYDPNTSELTTSRGGGGGGFGGGGGRVWTWVRSWLGFGLPLVAGIKPYLTHEEPTLPFNEMHQDLLVK